MNDTRNMVGPKPSEARQTSSDSAPSAAALTIEQIESLRRMPCELSMDDQTPLKVADLCTIANWTEAPPLMVRRTPAGDALLATIDATRASERETWAEVRRCAQWVIDDVDKSIAGLMVNSYDQSIVMLRSALLAAEEKKGGDDA